MRFERLRLSGFKSFVEPTELVIGKGLTGVVGPNGCGKSNLLEAIRWVMGEASARSLRGGGMEDVIFAGTAGRAARDFAEVTIVLDNEERAVASVLADDDRLEVMRRIERGAGSAYRLNGRDVRQKDVALLFADAATGAHSPALVSQGRIGAIISAKPQERRLLLEEAAGVSGLHVRRKDAEQRLRATETNLARLDDLLQQMETQAGVLRRQARAAERYRRLTDNIRIAEATLIFARWRDAAAAADQAAAEARTAAAAVETAVAGHRALAERQEAAARSLADLRTADSVARDALGRILGEVEALEGERARHAARTVELDAAAAVLERDRERESQLAGDAAAALARLTEERTGIDAQAVGIRHTLSSLGTRLAEAEAATTAAERRLAESIEAQAAVQADYRVAEAALAQAENAVRRAGAEVERRREEIGRLRAVAPDPVGIDAMAAEIERLAIAAATEEQRIAAADAARETAEQQREAARAVHAEASAHAKALESERAAVSRLAMLPESARASALARVRAAPGYEQALAAALGDDLDAAVGDAEAARSWRGGEGHGDPPLPPGAERLADHVEAPAELARRLAQIGVVATDDGTVPLALGQRLVTRDGLLRRWDGFVACGSGQAAAERLVQANRLVALDAALPGARTAVVEADAALAAAQTAQIAAREAESTARAALAGLERDRRDADGRLATLRAAAERHQAQLGTAEQAVATAESAFAGVEADRVSAAAALAVLPPVDAAVETATAARRETEVARAALATLRAEDAQARRQLDSGAARIAAIAGEVDGWTGRAGDAGRRSAELEERSEALVVERARLAAAPADFTRRAEMLAERAQMARETANAATDALRAGEQATAEAAKTLAEAAEIVAAVREGRAGALARAEAQEARRAEMARISGERFECPPPLLPERLGFASAEVADVPRCSANYEQLVLDRERIGPVNLVAERELAELEERRTSGTAEHEELTQAIHRLRGSIGALNREGRARLLAAFEAVDRHFRSLFTTLFEGGQAHLALVESDDPLEAGLEIMAQPPGKKLASLTLLSGGEQALTAVALIFALFLTNPAPICVLDEVDAPLDDANVERFCDLLDRMVADTDTRFLIVTHNAVTMSRMHRLYGVTMMERGISRLVSVDLQAAETLLAAE